MTTPQQLATYRQEHRWLASTFASVAVVIATLAGGYLIAASLNRDVADGSPGSGVTTRQRARSVSRVIDARLQSDRLKVLLGIVEAPADPEADALSGIAEKQGLMVKAVGAGDYAVSVIQAQAPKLSSMLARAASSEWPTIVGTWIGTLENDPGLTAAWTRLGDSAGDIRSFIERALAVDALEAAVAERLLADTTIATTPPGELDLAGKDLAARLAWGTAAVLFIGLWMAVVFICVWQMWTLAHPGFLVFGVVAAAVAGIVAWRADAIAPGSLELLGPLLAELEADGHTSIVRTSRFLTGLAAAAIVMMLCASAGLTKNDSPALLESQLEGLRSIFNAGAALLVAGVLEVAALYGWAAAAFEPATGTAGALSNVALVAAGFSGALFSAALVLVYLPAASTLRRRVPAGTPVVAEQGFSDSTLQQLGRLLQALAPLLAAIPLSGLIALLE